MILTSTLIIVMVTVVICGGSSVTLLTWLGIPLGVEDDDDKAPLSATASPANNHNYDSMAVGSTVPPGNTPADKSVAAKAWSGFDTKYMKPLLTHSNPTLMETLPACCARVARILTSSEQLARHPAMTGTSPEDPSSPDFIHRQESEETISVDVESKDDQRFPS